MVDRYWISYSSLLPFDILATLYCKRRTRSSGRRGRVTGQSSPTGQSDDASGAEVVVVDCEGETKVLDWLCMRANGCSWARRRLRPSRNDGECSLYENERLVSNAERASVGERATNPDVDGVALRTHDEATKKAVFPVSPPPVHRGIYRPTIADEFTVVGPRR